MEPSLQSLADQINNKSKDLKTDTFEVWGFQPVRSGDWVYVLLSAEAHGDRLDLIVDDSSQGSGPPGETRLVISLHDPRGLTASRSGLQVASASTITWGKDFRGVKPGEKAELHTENPPADAKNLFAFVARSI